MPSSQYNTMPTPPPSPPHRYLDARVEVETVKKVVPHSVATALASSVLPVPGGPNSSTPCGGGGHGAQWSLVSVRPAPGSESLGGWAAAASGVSKKNSRAPPARRQCVSSQTLAGRRRSPRKRSPMSSGMLTFSLSTRFASARPAGKGRWRGSGAQHVICWVAQALSRAARARPPGRQPHGERQSAAVSEGQRHQASGVIFLLTCDIGPLDPRRGNHQILAQLLHQPPLPRLKPGQHRLQHAAAALGRRRWPRRR